MNLLLIIGSQRHSSGSARVAGFIRDRWESLFPGTEVDEWDLGKDPLPLWDEGVWRGEPEWTARLAPVRAAVQRADAYVLVVPEYNGMASPAMKNFSLFFDERHTGHKPALLAAVTSERANGQYPVADMRAFGLKNNKWVFVPDHLIFRNVPDALTGDDGASLLMQRTDYALKELRAYARLLKDFRRHWVFDDRFKYAP